MMDRRRFAQLVVALFAGRAVVEIEADAAPTLLARPVTVAGGPMAALMPFTLDPSGGYFVPQEVADEIRTLYERDIIYGTGRGSEPIGIMTKEK